MTFHLRKQRSSTMEVYKSMTSTEKLSMELLQLSKYYFYYTWSFCLITSLITSTLEMHTIYFILACCSLFATSYHQTLHFITFDHSQDSNSFSFRVGIIVETCSHIGSKVPLQQQWNSLTLVIKGCLFEMRLCKICVLPNLKYCSTAMCLQFQF